MSFALHSPAHHGPALGSDPGKRLAFGVAVVLLHVVLIWGLTTGLGKKVLEVVKKPLTVSILEVAPTPPEPAPPVPVVSRPRQPQPPQPRQISALPVETSAPVQTASTVLAAPAIEEAPPVVAPAAPPAPPVPVAVAVACPNHQSVPVDVPLRALRLGLSGQVTAEFTVTAAGAVRDIRIVQSSNSIFDPAVTAAIAQYRCMGQGRDVRVRIPFIFKGE